MRKNFFLWATLALGFNAGAQIVNIPDANFKNALVNTPCIGSWEGPLIGDVDTNDDGEIQVSEALAVEILDVSNQNIASLEGIEAFVGLHKLDCSNNQLTALTLTASPLYILDCSHNLLTTLITDFFNSTMVDEYEMSLDCSYNNLTSFTMPSDLFIDVNVSNNPLTQINTPAGSFSRYLSLNNTAFTTFSTSSLSAQFLGLSNCPNLTSAEIYIDAATLTNNTQLLSLKMGSCGHYSVHDDPLLQSIDIKDGYDCFIEPDWPGVQLDFIGNPSLLYVCLDDVGNWYYEGEWFFQAEITKVQVDPGVTLTYYCDFTPGGNYNTVTGTVTMDADGNGCDSSDPGTSNTQIKLTQGTNNLGMTFSDTLGNFSSYVTGGNQTLTPQFFHPYYTISPASYTTAFSGTGNTETINFCIAPSGAYNDLDVTIIPTSPARPGFNATYKIHYENKGTETQSGTISLTFEDEITDVVNASPAVSSQVANMLSWNFIDLMPFESREITLELNINSPLETPAVNIGDSIGFNAVVNGAADETPNDNTFVLNQVVVGSFDPNDKIVSRESIGIAQLGDDLYYTVRFQNTGTFYAENVVIRDLLSKNLDLSTLQVVSTSHPCRTLLTPENDFTAADKLEFFFEGINLPAVGDDEPGSHGYVTFRIKPKNTLVIGNTIENQADIYFDFNTPITTNTVTTAVTALGNPEVATASFVLYPNPVKNMVSIQTDAVIKAVRIYNALGQLVKNAKNQTTIDVSDLTPGSYVVEIISAKGKATKKLIKL